MTVTHRQSGTKLHYIWIEMRQRCCNPNHRNYHHYGARGIKVTEEWLENFETFKMWSEKNGYGEGLSLDRIKNDKGYSPDNCRWVTQMKQCNNTRRNKMISYKGTTQSMADWSRELGLNYKTLCSRSRNGWTAEKMFEVPMEGRSYVRNKIIR